MLLACVVLPAIAAELEPPLVAMAGSEFQLVAGDILAVEADPPAIRLRVVEALRGEARGELRLRITPQDQPLLAPGAGYLVLYTDLVPVPLKPRQWMQAPDQARLLSFEGVEISLFRDTPVWRTLLMRDPVGAAAAPRYRRQLFDGLAAADPQLADLWSGELAVRLPQLGPLSTSEIAQVDAFVRSAQAPLRARARLLLLAHDHRPLLGTDSWADAAAAILASTPVQADPPAALQALVQAALLVVTAHPDAVDPRSVSPWLASAPMLAELAALALRAHAPASERAALDTALARPLLPTTTRSFLEQHRQRLQLQAAPTSSDRGKSP